MTRSSGWGGSTCRGASSQIELDQEFANLFVLRDRLVARATAFLDWAGAREAAGIGE